MSMKRRQFIGLLGGAAAWPLGARAQQPAMPVIGWLNAESPRGALRNFIPAFHLGLSETGYVEGRNVSIEYRWAEGHADRLPAFAADLVRRRVSVIVTLAGTLAALAAKSATTTIPIVFQTGADPVELGLVSSLNRPGANLTGITILATEMSAKRVQLLHELVPAAKSIALLVNPTNPYLQAETRDLDSAARVLGVRVQLYNAGTERDIAEAFSAIVEQGVGAAMIASDIFFWVARDQIISLAARYSIPTMFSDNTACVAGGLLSYAADISGGFHQGGIYTGRILMGQKPADLPVVQPTKFLLSINLKTAKTLGLAIPPDLLAIADEVIE
jgi:putative ABC transport system substrate-binding protein